MAGEDLRDFIAYLADALAWPVVVLVVVLILRPYLGTLTSLIATIKYRGVEVNFDRAIQDVAERAESIQSTDDEEPAVKAPPEAVRDPDPRIAVLKSWAWVEGAIEELLDVHLPGVNRRRLPAHKRVEMLQEAGVINFSLAGALREMRVARNFIAHGEDIPMDDRTLQLFTKAAAHLHWLLNKDSERLQVNHH